MCMASRKKKRTLLEIRQWKRACNQENVDFDVLSGARAK